MHDRRDALHLDALALANGIAAAYVSNNHVARTELPALIRSIHGAIVRLAAGGDAPAEAPIERPSPTQVRQSIANDRLISFIDGRAYKTLKRHLTGHGLTPERYRERYGLPADYPMICASYREQRSNLSRAIGLRVPGARAKRAPKGREAA